MSETSREQQLIVALQQSAMTVQKLKTRLNAYSEPIAIIGMGCRFPGDSHNPELFWQLLAQGRDAVMPMPVDRRSGPSHQTASPPYAGGFLAQVDRFDAAFFGISPRETNLMDPQQRLLLEVGWEALENAALVPEALFNSLTGLFIGMSSYDYATLIQEQAIDSAQDELYQVTGIAPSVAAGRLAYTFGFTGPAVVVDTACSASLVAVHQACQSLRQRECHLALAGGVHLILSDRWAASGSQTEGSMFALDGRCKTFDAAADGFGRGEGCGLVVLKRLSDAQADGDTILAVIRGSAINQDGRSSGLSAPSGPSQQAVIRQALQNAGLEPDQVGYIEAHGTGTKLGDPIEIGALNAVFGRRADPLWVGSVKTNFGHLEGAAGIAGLIKVVLGLQHGQIPPNLHFHQPNPYIDWHNAPIQIPVALLDWPSDKKIAGISSFGISGTNAHIVVEGMPTAPPPEHKLDRPYQLFTLAAKTAEALQAYAQRYQAFLAAQPHQTLGDLCYTSHVGRSHFAHRLSLVADTPATLQAQLAQYGTPQTSAQSAP
ncbi:MAG: beta-ketoacyl synthase N-terminal-like domain-containing protein, partial [Chloroflexi bacterium]|nr:beta-ketoacyl synthase N-terminal-like domain-containing protein [Chloroflexota bacterium]